MIPIFNYFIFIIFLFNKIFYLKKEFFIYLDNWYLKKDL
jgi:hypothetical protein